MSNPAFEQNPYFSKTPQPTVRPAAGQAVAPGMTATSAGNPYADYEVANLNYAYQQPAAGPAQTGRMTYDDVIMKTAGVLALIIGAGALNWFVFQANPILTYGGLIAGLILGIVNAVKREPSPALIMGYAVAEGLFLGGISMVFEAIYPGIVLQAVLATGATFIASLILFSSGVVRVTPKLTRFVLIALVGYALFSLVNLGIILFGNQDAAFGLRSSVTIAGIPLGILIGIFAVGLAAICLIMDFDAIARGVQRGAPARMAWAAAFSLALTLVWLYIEFLRLIAIFRE